MVVLEIVDCYVAVFEFEGDPIIAGNAHRVFAYSVADQRMKCANALALVQVPYFVQ